MSMSFGHRLVSGLIFACLFLGAPLAAAENNNHNKYVFPATHSGRSAQDIDYQILNDFLSQLVYHVGLSEHTPAPRAKPPTGSRLPLPANRKASRLEGNRIYYHDIEPDNIEYLKYLTEYLLTIPKDIDLTNLHKDAQLAYWLNLHNITAITVIAENYPISNIEKLYVGGRKCVLFLGCKEIKPGLNITELEINGRLFTLAELRSHILTNWTEPLVMYGLYMGYIGSPNIRETAYTERNVWQNLERNAREFVNSIRGTRKWGKALKVSGFYEFGREFFPDFENDIKAHFSYYGKPKVQAWLAKDPAIDVSIHNWGINDLFNGRPYNSDIYLEFRDRQIRKIRRQRARTQPTVEIEEIDSGAAAEPKTNDENEKSEPSP